MNFRFLSLLLVLLLVGVSCSQKDEQFCLCMQSSKSLDAVAQKLVQDPTNVKLASSFKLLKNKKASDCKPYVTMNGEEMLKRKANCK